MLGTLLGARVSAVSKIVKNPCPHVVYMSVCAGGDRGRK